MTLEELVIKKSSLHLYSDGCALRFCGKRRIVLEGGLRGRPDSFTEKGPPARGREAICKPKRGLYPTE